MSDIKCAYMDRKGFDDYYCTKVEHNVPYDTYTRYCTSYSYSDCPNYKYEKPTGGCYLTTATCEILGLNDRNIYLTLFRRFRKDYLQKNPEGLPILVQYDTVGPMIARRLNNDPNKKMVAFSMLKEYIGPIAQMLAEDYVGNSKPGIRGNYAKAINMYAQMTQSLIERYQLQTVATTIPGEDKFDFKKDYSEYGHGRKKR